jgi:hypothetical protein
MRVELIELLRAREVVHPSRITQLHSNHDGAFLIEVSGYPWWNESPLPSTDERATFYFEGITDGTFDFTMFGAESFERDLEPFSVQPLSTLEWARGAYWRVYCTAPLSRPLDVYARLHDFLISIACPYAPTRYLNAGYAGLLSDFSQIASSNSFLLCSGPEAICQVVCSALENQAVGFNVITQDADQSIGSLWVELWDSRFVCESAYAVFRG